MRVLFYYYCVSFCFFTPPPFPPYSGGEFKRTLEGSAVVFFTTLVAVAPMYSPLGLFSETQYALAMCLLPPLMTVTEAFAPHTWDNPFITLVGAAYILLTYELVP